MRIHVVVFAFLCVSTTVEAEILRVGLYEPLTRIADAAKRAKDGDIVEILPGKYHADVAVWGQKQLTIRGIGERPVLIADGASAEGKAIWVIRNGDFRIHNVEFRGARVPDGNGAGIRLERGRLHVSASTFIDNENGILTANQADAELRIESCVFAQAPRRMDPLPHLLYVVRIARLEVGPDILDFTLAPNSILRRLGTEPGQARGYSLAPAAEFALPVGTRSLPAPARWAPGAFQTSGYAP